jgi:ferrous iron transport protein A
MNPSMYLCDMFPGQTARISYLYAGGSMRRRLQDLGCLENTLVTCLGRSPLGDPSAFLIRGSVIALRKKDSQKILVTEKD